jgi:putative membrane protein
MWISAVTAYLHYLGFMLAFAALVLESQVLKPDLSLQEAWRVVWIDAIYGLSATMILVTGVMRVIYFGKGTDYYLSSPAFYTKIGIFIVVSLFSLYPTFSFLSWVKRLRFLSWVKRLRDGHPPSLTLSQVQRLTWLIRGELIGFSLIPLFAAIMARGIRLF